VFGKPTQLRRSNSSSPTGGTVAVDRTYVYDGFQQLCQMIEPETGSTFMGYDAANNLLWSASGYATTTPGCMALSSVAARRADRTYDARNRITSLTFPDGRGNQSWTYTPDGLPEQIITYNAPNLTAPVINAYHYNRRRMLDGQGESISQTGWYTWGIGYGYDRNGSVASHVYPNDLAITYLPNALGQPTQVGSYASGVSYYPNGALKQFTYGNGIVHTLSQNVRGLPDVSKDAYGTTSFLNDGYNYDANANVIAITDAATGRGQRGNRTMTYDELDRLKKAVSPMYGAAGANYTYDVLDNLTQVNIGGTKARNEYYCYGADWRLTFVRNGPVCTGSTASGAVHALEYDVQGNLREKDNQVFSFDFGNRLRSVGTAESYRYDGHGRRVVANNTAGNILSQYSYTGQLFFQSDVRVGLSKAYMYLGGSLVAIREQPLTGGTAIAKYQHTDALGSPVAVTNASRVVLEQNEYEPYGKVIAPAAPHDGPGYTGHVFDSATGMNYMQQRYYDPVIGRFLSVDPVAVRPIGDNFNRYWYANNNPYKFTDPDGRDSYCFMTGLGCGQRPYTQEDIAKVELSMKGLAAFVAAPLLAWEGAMWLLTNPGVVATGTEAAAALAGISGTAGSIRGVNAIRGTKNCVNCAIATEATLAGRPASAMPGGPQPIAVLEQMVGRKFGAPTSIDNITKVMAGAGNGARGIVFGSRGGEVGHVFNVANQKGVVRYLDGQTGKEATFSGYKDFQLLRTD
jgi:RHS repeat-associated protein